MISIMISPLRIQPGARRRNRSRDGTSCSGGITAAKQEGGGSRLSQDDDTNSEAEDTSGTPVSGTPRSVFGVRKPASTDTAPLAVLASQFLSIALALTKPNVATS